MIIKKSSKDLAKEVAIESEEKCREAFKKYYKVYGEDLKKAKAELEEATNNLQLLCANWDRGERDFYELRTGGRL